MTYAWEYLYKSEPRAQKLYEIIASYIKDCRSVIDMNCGMAPLYPYLRGMKYTGFDKNEAVIAQLKLDFPHGNWICCADKDFPTQEADLLLLLGLTDGKHPEDSPTQMTTFRRLAANCKVAIVEYSHKIAGFGEIIGRYDAEFMNHHKERIVARVIKPGTYQYPADSLQGEPS